MDNSRIDWDKKLTKKERKNLKKYLNKEKQMKIMAKCNDITENLKVRNIALQKINNKLNTMILDLYTKIEILKSNYFTG